MPDSSSANTVAPCERCGMDTPVDALCACPVTEIARAQEPRDVKLIPSISDVLNKHDDDWLPSLTIQVELAPWYWRVGWYSAPINGHFLILYLGPVRVNLWA